MVLATALTRPSPCSTSPDLCVVRTRRAVHGGRSRVPAARSAPPAGRAGLVCRGGPSQRWRGRTAWRGRDGAALAACFSWSFCCAAGCCEIGLFFPLGFLGVCRPCRSSRSHLPSWLASSRSCMSASSTLAHPALPRPLCPPARPMLGAYRVTRVSC